MTTTTTIRDRQDLTKTALLVIDVQNSFCPPDGSLAVPRALEILPVINSLSKLPFRLKIATQDWHPEDHISFASSHPGTKAFESTVTISNPLNSIETKEIRLWPDHCVQGTRGAELHPDLDRDSFTHVIKKGQEAKTEMFSAFRDVFEDPSGSESELANLLREQGIKRCVVVGLATDYCVRWTATHAVQGGWDVVLLREGVRGVQRDCRGNGEGQALDSIEDEFGALGIHVKSLKDMEWDA